MLRSKRDIDRHVELLESKVHSEAERNLKALNIAKLYFNIGEYETARKYLVKYLSVRENSAMAFKLNGQVLEKLQQREKALQSYRRSFELDQSQKDLILKVCELLISSGDSLDKSKARHWLELGEKFYASHRNVAELRRLIKGEDACNENGKELTSAEASPEVSKQEEITNLEDSALWSRSAAANSYLNGSRYGYGLQSYQGTPNLEGSTSTPKKFVPRPSPERLAAQVKSLESTQDKMIEVMAMHHRDLVEELKNHSISTLRESKVHRDHIIEEMKMQRQNIADIKIEMNQGLANLKYEVTKSNSLLERYEDTTLKHLKEICEALNTLPRKIAEALPRPTEHSTIPQQASVPTSGKPLGLSELQEALAQQTALLQMSSLGYAVGMFNRPPGPPLPQFPPPGPSGLQPPPPSFLPQHPLPPTDKTLEYQINLSSTTLRSQEAPTIVAGSAVSPSVASAPVSVGQKSSSIPITTVAAQVVTTSAPSTSGTNLFDKFKPKAGSWECSGCMMRNEGSVIQCPACETPKPGCESEVKQKQEASKATISFGAQGGFKFSSPAGGASTSGFSFGAVTTTQSGSTGSTSTSFTFTLPGSTTAKESEVTSDGHLSFQDQQLKLNTKEDAQAVASKIANFKNLKKLTFSGNTIGIEAAKVIGEALEKHTQFTHAHWKDMFTGRMKTEIPPALQNLSNGIIKAQARLVELDLSDNAFGPIGMEGIKDLLKSPCCYTLKELKLHNTGCGVTGGKLLAKTLMECYNESKKAGTPLALRVFVLGRSRQENEGAKALAEVFKVMGSLEEVVMPQNGIYHEGIAALSNAFANNPKLHTINMNDNTFTEKGAAAFAKALPKLQKLRYLNLGDCLLKTEGGKLIADAIKTGHAELEELHLDSNEMKVDAGIAVAEAVKNKPNMKKLFIGTNCFGSDGCEKIIKVLGAKSYLVGEEIEDDEGDFEDEEEEGHDSDESEKEDEGKEEKPSINVVPAVSSSPFSFSSPSSGGIFGKSSTSPSATRSIFATSTPSASIFGGASSSQPTATPSIFGSTSTSIFGKNSTSSETKEFTFSLGKDAPSFASVAAKNVSNTTATSIFGSNQNSTFSFAGAGSKLFQTPPAPQTNATSPEKDDDDKVPEDPNHDPHFEPIIPLPELVQVTTGEEEEEVLFKHRAKVFRFDKETKQWKERGIGDMKILKHPVNNTFRVLLRREQIHKIACNHYITKDMELKPMMGSETALTWFAMDYADEEAKLENLAVKFKHAETTKEFKEVFEKCQTNLGSSPKKEGTSLPKVTENVKTPEKSQPAETAPKKEEEKTPEQTSKPNPFAGFAGFGGTSAASPIFGTPKANGPESSPAQSIFATPAGGNKTIFGSPNSTITGSPTIFGGSSSLGKNITPDKPAENSKGTDLSAGKDLTSFSSLAAGASGFSFGSKTPSGSSHFSFAPVFGNQKTPDKVSETKEKTPSKENDDDKVPEDPDHDPHFEPIIPLPELVKVTTGEEEEEIVFKHRAKVYRYDVDSKQWKERGIGDIKILKHPQRNTFRVLLRREQIHKIACNHYITKDMELKPMLGSETALCWFAMDYADEEAKLEQMAVRFKTEETKNDFKKKFEDCQSKLTEKASSSPAKGKEDSQVPKVSNEAKKSGEEEQKDDEEDEEEEEEEDDDDEDTPMFERKCNLFQIHNNGDNRTREEPLGEVELQIVYDVDVYGARIVAYPMDSGEEVCSHLIALQTVLRVEESKNACYWSALDFSMEPPLYRSFKAVFENGDDLQEYKEAFNEGKELAENSEIIELSSAPDPDQPFYYGQGGDYESPT